MQTSEWGQGEEFLRAALNKLLLHNYNISYSRSTTPVGLGLHSFLAC